MMDDRILDKLVNKFDDFTERLIRIEENVKGFSSVKEELETTKVDVAQVKEAAKSAHKRLDTMEEAQKQKDQDIKWLKRQILTGAIGWIFTVLAAVTIFILKMN